MKHRTATPRPRRLLGRSRAAAALLLTAALIAGTGALPASAQETASDPSGTSTAAMSAQEQDVLEVFNGINEFRAGKGLPPLRLGMEASAVAQEWSEEMSRSGFEHSVTYSSDPRIAGYRSAGENIAYAFGHQSGQVLVDAWIGSPAHNEGMSNPGDNVIGVGLYRDAAGTLWGTTTFYTYDPLPARTYTNAAAYFAAMAVPAVPGPKPVITGTPAWGETLRGTEGAWPAGTSLSYQWWIGSSRIDGATGLSVKVPAEAAGRKIYLMVTARKAGYRDTILVSDPTARIPNPGTVINTRPPQITGTPEWGKTLTVDPGVWEEGTKLSYAWETGEIGPTRVIEKYDTYLSVEVTGTKPGKFPLSLRADIVIPAPKLVYTEKPFITGDPIVGRTLVAKPGTWNVKPSVRYTWLRNGKEIPGTEGYTMYTPTDADLGSVISIRASASADGYQGATVTSNATAKIQPMPAVRNLSKPAITGTAVEGYTLTSTPGTWEGDVHLDYQWLREGKPISGERANFINLTRADVGKKISLQVIGMRQGFVTTTVTTASVTIAAETAPVPTPTPAPSPTKPPAPKPTPSPSKSFRDVPAGMQFATEINWMNSKGISTGWSDNTYRPLQPVARDAMSAFMYRLAGSPAYTAPTKSPFKDIVLGQQFYKEMSWLSATKVSTGWDDRTYRPLASVNRDAMAAFMYRLAGSPAYTPPKKSPFTDVPVSSQFYKEISWLAAQGISTGWQQPNGTRVYKPLEPVKRDAMAAFMYRLDQKGFKLSGSK